MPCWSCHLCHEWNQPTMESCSECCHYKCGLCKVHYDMSYTAHNGSFNSSEQVISHFMCFDVIANYWSRTSRVTSDSSNKRYVTNQVTNHFPPAATTSNMDGFLANQKTHSLAEINSEESKEKAAEAWKRVVQTRGIDSRMSLVLEPKKS